MRTETVRSGKPLASRPSKTDPLRSLLRPPPAPIPIPDLVDLNSTVVMKSEYQHGHRRQGGCPISASKLPGLRAGCFPKKLVLCASRKPGSAYVQQDIYAVPPGYHGTAHQAGTMNHYEYGTTLFLEGGSRTKHISQTDASTGMPTLMPDSDAASELFPWRWGQHNIAKGKIQVCFLRLVLFFVHSLLPAQIIYARDLKFWCLGTFFLLVIKHELCYMIGSRDYFSS